MNLLTKITCPKWLFCLAFLCFCLNGLVHGQDVEVAVDTSKKKKNPLKGLLPLPAISYSPETSMTMGAAILYNFSLAKGDPDTRKSNARLLAIYTLKKQIIMEGRWDFITKGENYRMQGRTYYHKYPDRNYGIGGDAGAVVFVVDGDANLQQQNYFNYQNKRLHFATTLLRKIRPSLYAGLDYEFESLFDEKILDDIFYIENPERFSNPTKGIRSGLGLHLSFDNRDNLVNAYKGFLITVSNRFYQPFFGSDFTYTSVDLDFRTYKEIWKDQVFAFNIRSQNKLASEEIPVRSLGRFGGADFVKGYFFGTYQDKNVLAFQSEFRSVLVRFPNFPLLKGLGAVAFFNGGHAFHEWNNFDISQFRFSVGGGIRLLFLPEDRTNVGIDYSIGLHKKSGGDKRQTGIYFTIGETF